MSAPTGGPSTALRRVLGGLAALVSLVVLVVAVPVLLVVGVGNPWPGGGRVEMVDTEAIALGAAAALTWIAWARFTLAVLIEIPTQWREVEAERQRPTGAPPIVAAPTRHRAGFGLVAARLVAAVLVLVPVGVRAAPAAATPPSLVRAAPAVVVPEPHADGSTSVPPPPAPGEERRTVAPASAPTPAGATVVVVEGDTLRGLARRHLGDADRWREIFELNRDRAQPVGGRLTSPSVLRVGWSLALPGNSTAPPPVPPAPTAPPDVPPWPGGAAPEHAVPILDASVVTVEAGDTLWDLTRARLEVAERPADDHHIVVELGRVVLANPAVQDDPDLIHPGDRISFPALTAAPGPSPADATPTTSPPPPPAGPADAAAGPAVPVAASATTTTSAATVTAGASVSSTTTARPVRPEPTASGTESSVGSDSIPVPPAGADGGDDIPTDRPAPAPIGLGEAALLSTGVLAMLAARRQRRLRAAEPRARLPEPPPEQIVTERRLRAVDASERLVRVDIAVRAAAASLLESIAQPAVVSVGADGAVELILTADAALPGPWVPSNGRWVLPGSVPIEMLADAARRVGAPCLALTQLGVDEDERDVLVDLEALGVLGVRGPDEAVEAVVRGLAATLASSIFAEPANLVGVGLDDLVFLDHRLSHHVDGVESALELAATLVGTTATTAGSRHSTFVLRARHTSGESWEPAVIVVGPRHAHEVTPELVHTITRRRGGLALVVGGDAFDGGWNLIADGPSWRLDPLGIRLTPVGLSPEDLAAVYEVLHGAQAPLVPDALASGECGGDRSRSEGDGDLVITAAGTEWNTADVAEPEPAWSLLVRLLGEVEVVDRAGRPVRFERSKTLELVAWLAGHRDRSTRSAARTALWELDVRDATFANVVSEARRALARHVAPPAGEEWLERTLTERLPLHELVVTDADLVRARLDHARLSAPQQAIDTLRPAVELIRGAPFSGTGYLWPDPEGITSNLVLLATTAATELAGHYLSIGDVEGVFWATARGLQVLPGHEQLIALRMRAHHRAGDLAGVRQEWESYERVLDADPWGDGEPAPELVELRRHLLSTTAASAPAE